MKDNFELAANRVADNFVKNTKIKQLDPILIISLIGLIIQIVRYCESKRDVKSFREAANSALSGWKRYIGIGRIVRRNLNRAVSEAFPELNSEELIKAMLEAAVDAHDDELEVLISSVSKIDHTPN